VSFASITLCIASQRVFIVVYFVIDDSVRKLSDTPSYSTLKWVRTDFVVALSISTHISILSSHSLPNDILMINILQINSMSDLRMSC
jgi:hypothetical protein